MVAINDRKLLKKASSSFVREYKHGLDGIPEFIPVTDNYFQ
jgi:uncharacterized protein YkvS